MSKSLDFIKSRFDVDNNFIKEIPSEEYFDIALKGQREKVRDYNGGKINTRLMFDENADFTWECYWSGVRFNWENDLDETLEDFVYKVLTSQPQVPLQEDGQLIGGNIEPGDTIEFTFGNFIIEDKITMNEGIEEERTIFVPYKYERKAGDIYV